MPGGCTWPSKGTWLILVGIRVETSVKSIPRNLPWQPVLSTVLAMTGLSETNIPCMRNLRLNATLWFSYIKGHFGEKNNLFHTAYYDRVGFDQITGEGGEGMLQTINNKRWWAHILVYEWKDWSLETLKLWIISFTHSSSTFSHS